MQIRGLITKSISQRSEVIKRCKAQPPTVLNIRMCVLYNTACELNQAPNGIQKEQRPVPHLQLFSTRYNLLISVYSPLYKLRRIALINSVSSNEIWMINMH